MSVSKRCVSGYYHCIISVARCLAKKRVSETLAAAAFYSYFPAVLNWLVGVSSESRELLSRKSSTD